MREIKLSKETADLLLVSFRRIVKRDDRAEEIITSPSPLPDNVLNLDIAKPRHLRRENLPVMDGEFGVSVRKNITPNKTRRKI